MDQHWDDLLRARSVFPTLQDDVIGAKHISTAPFYKEKGHPVFLSFQEPLTHESIEEVNQVIRPIIDHLRGGE